jgi:hypothetical protein
MRRETTLERPLMTQTGSQIDREGLSEIVEPLDANWVKS